MNNESTKQLQQPKVTIKVTHGGSTSTTECRFHTPTILKNVKETPDGSTVTVLVTRSDGVQEVLINDSKDKVVNAVAKSVIKPDAVCGELKKFMQFLLDHSDLKIIGAHGVIFDKNDDKINGFGHMISALNCTEQEAITCVNCGDANIDKFVERTRLSIPGREKVSDDKVVLP